VIDRHLLQHRDFLDGVCITGGEPLLYEEVEDYLRHLKAFDLLVKLDTNGTIPHMLKRVIEEGVVDYVAMDIKAPLRFEDYSRSTGIRERRLFDRVKESIEILMEADIDYEFRTTVVPTIHTEGDIEEIAHYIKGAKRFVLQNFRQRQTLDPRYEKVEPYPIDKIKRMGEAVAGYVREILIRGR
jgi:pyruvate formate lyase activating enzyme